MTTVLKTDLDANFLGGCLFIRTLTDCNVRTEINYIFLPSFLQLKLGLNSVSKTEFSPGGRLTNSLVVCCEYIIERLLCLKNYK